jgi:hypothetical protein
MGEALSVLDVMESANASMAHLTYQNLSISDLSKRFMVANAWAQQVISG